MIGTEFLKGQGLGNQLFCYVSTRCIALDKNLEFGVCGTDVFKGADFFINTVMDTFKKNSVTKNYNEKEDRVFIANSVHDLTYGCYISGADKELYSVSDNTLIYGNLQSEFYFGNHKEEIKEWLSIKPEYDNFKDYSSDNICVINVRGGEYRGDRALYLRKKYWHDAVRKMKTINPDMRFVVISDDEVAAKRIFPKFEVHHFDVGRDYAAIKNAHYAILSNSSFAFFPIFTSDTIKMAIAPKYWARHNVSNGYWASEQNIYSCFIYMDRKGKLFTAEECKRELDDYKKNNYITLCRKKSDIKNLKFEIFLIKIINLVKRIFKR